MLSFLVTWAVQVAGLFFHAELFGNGDGWVRSISYDSFGDRVGLISATGLFSAAVCGVWWLLVPWLLRIIARRSFSSSHIIATALWLTIVQIDYYFREELMQIAGGGFGLDAFEDGAGDFSLIVHRIWHWFGWTIIWGVGQSLLVFVLLLYGLRRLSGRPMRVRLGTRALARSPRKWVAATLFASFLYGTAGAKIWPTTVVVLEYETIVGRIIEGTIKSVSDFDGDGWSPFDAPPDSEPFDRTIHPHAVDIPDDGIDQDALLGDLRLRDVPSDMRAQIDAMAAYAPVRFTSRRNIVVVILESVRYSALVEETVDGRVVMPHLRRLVREGALSCPDFYAARGFTLPSLGDLLWGGFARSTTTLIDDFSSNGYETLAFSGYDLETEGLISMGLGDTDFRFDAGDVNPGPNPTTVPARVVMDRIEEVLGRRDGKRPFFLFAHLKDPHFPYRAENELILTNRQLQDDEFSPEHREQVRRCYLDQVHHVDRACGRLVRFLNSSGLADNTTVIFVADHGESLYEDGRSLGHGTAINERMMRCAMVVWNPRQDVPTPMSHVHLRQYIRDSLSRPTATAALRPTPDRTLLHYLSSARAPSKIGWYRVARDAAGRRTSESRLIYDFRTNVLWDETENRGGPFERGKIDDALHARGAALIRSWEYMRYANRRNAAF